MPVQGLSTIRDMDVEEFPPLLLREIISLIISFF